MVCYLNLRQLASLGMCLHGLTVIFPTKSNSSSCYIRLVLSLGPLWYLCKWTSAHVYAKGRKQYYKLYYCLWRVSIKPNSHFLIFNVFFVSEGNIFLCLFYYTAAGVSGMWWRPYLTLVQIIFHVLWDQWAHYGIFENWVLFMYMLEGVSSVANFIIAYEKSQ